MEWDGEGECKSWEEEGGGGAGIVIKINEVLNGSS